MKNAITAVLALLCGFLGWKLYKNSKPVYNLMELQSTLFKTLTSTDRRADSCVLAFSKNLVKDDPQKKNIRGIRLSALDLASLNAYVEISKSDAVYFSLSQIVDKDIAAEIVTANIKDDPTMTIDKVMGRPFINIFVQKSGNQTLTCKSTYKVCPPPNGVCP